MSTAKCGKCGQARPSVIVGDDFPAFVFMAVRKDGSIRLERGGSMDLIVHAMSEFSALFRASAGSATA